MIDMEINENIENYRTGNFKGLSLKQVVFALATVAIGGGVTMGLYVFLHMPIQAAIYFAIPFSLPCALTGFYKKNGMSFPMTVKKVMRIRLSRPYKYESTEEAHAVALRSSGRVGWFVKRVKKEKIAGRKKEG